LLFSYQPKHLFCKLLFAVLIFSAVISSIPSGTFASEISNGNHQSKIKVLCYHHIVPDHLEESKATVVTVSDFEAQMKYLYEHGYYTASLRDLEEFLYNQKKLPEKTVVITFDDGYELNYIYAYPTLKKYGFKALIFLIGNRITQGMQDPNAISKLSREQIQEMAASGLVEFGNHTFNAHDFVDGRPLLQTMTYEEILADFEKVNLLFEQMDLPQPKSIAYPFGMYSEASILAAKTSGYNIGFSVRYGFVYQNSNPMLLNRIIIADNLDIDQFKALLQDESEPLPEGFEESILLPLNSDTAYISGKPTLLSAPIEVVNGVYLAPLSLITEQLKWDLIWDATLFQVSIKPSNNAQRFFCVPAYEINGKIMVPLYPLANAMGYEASFLENEQMIKLKKP